LAEAAARRAESQPHVAEQLAAARAEGVETGSDTQQEALLQTIIHEIGTDGIRAWSKYRIPKQGVRIGNFGGPYLP
jgi:hypothetical protein